VRGRYIAEMRYAASQRQFSFIAWFGSMGDANDTSGVVSRRKSAGFGFASYGDNRQARSRSKV
jgi:hypothetical protein